MLYKRKIFLLIYHIVQLLYRGIFGFFGKFLAFRHPRFYIFDNSDDFIFRGVVILFDYL